METITTITQIIYYVAMSIAGPLAVLAYLKVKSTGNRSPGSEQ
jgi:hypothetical protein